MTTSLSQRAFAAHVGLSPTMVRKLVAKGTLPQNPDKTIPVAEGVAALNARPEARQRLVVPPPPAPMPRPPEPRPPPKTPPTVAEQMAASAETRRVETVGKVWRARLAELEYRRQSGQFVAVADVEKATRALCETVRAQITSLPGRVALQVEAIAAGPAGSPKAAAIEALIADEVNAILSVLHNARLVPPAEKEGSDDVAE